MVWITETLPRQARDLPWLLIGKSFGEIFLDGLYSGSACLCFSRRSQLCHKGFRSPTSLQRTANCRIRRCLKKRFTPSTHKQQGSTGVEPYSVILSIKNTYFNQNAVLEHNPHKKGACSMPAPNEIRSTIQAAIGFLAPFAVGFGVAVFAAFALSFVANSCLTLVVMAPTSTL